MPKAGILVQPVPGAVAALLKTGQTTQYNAEADDGLNEKGIARSYTVLSTGPASGTTNVDLEAYTAATISFDSATKTVADSANGLAVIKTGDVIVISGSVSNNGVFNVAGGGVAGSFTTTEALVDEVAGASVTIKKREAISNNCVWEVNTKLMWTRYPPTKLGGDSNKNMVWTGQPYDIFAYAAAASTAGLGGYSDWRVPNIFELLSLWNAATGVDTTAFPTNVNNNSFWSSTTVNTATTKAHTVALDDDDVSVISRDTKASPGSATYVILVRGG